MNSHRHGRVPTIIEEKGAIPSGGLNRAVIRKFNCNQMVPIAVPIIQLKIDVVAQHFLNNPISPFCLTISLRVVRRTHAQLRASQAKQSTPKLAGKAGIPVRHKLLRIPMVAEHVRVEKMSNVFGGTGCSRRRNVYHLGQAIHENSNGVVARRCSR